MIKPKKKDWPDRVATRFLKYCQVTASFLLRKNEGKLGVFLIKSFLKPYRVEVDRHWHGLDGG